MTRYRFLTEDVKLVVFNTITVVGAGLAYLIVGYIPEYAPMLVIVCFAMVNIVTGAASGGFYKCSVLYARLFNT